MSFGGGHPPPVPLPSAWIAPGLKEALETGLDQRFPSYFFESICASMFIAVLFTIAKTWKQPKLSSTDERIKKMWYKYTTEYYPVIKKDELFLSVTTWIDLDDTRLKNLEKDKKKKKGVRERTNTVKWKPSHYTQRINRQLPRGEQNSGRREIGERG